MKDEIRKLEKLKGSEKSKFGEPVNSTYVMGFNKGLRAAEKYYKKFISQNSIPIEKVGVEELAEILYDELPCYEREENSTVVIEGRVVLENIAQVILNKLKEKD